MAAILISTPEYNDVYISRWLATESPNNFRLQRNDYVVTVRADSGGFLKLTLSTGYTGSLGNSISCYDSSVGIMRTGLVTVISGNDVTTDITYIASTFDYLNDFTARANYYFEGRLTINGIVNDMTVISSPDTFGFADLDVSGVLQTFVANDKEGDYSADFIAETSKSGKFTIEYREVWYESAEAYTAEGNTWYYAEFVRSKAETSNIHEYTQQFVSESPADTFNYTNPVCNLFEQPVFFAGLPFDLSFIEDVPGTDKTITSVVRKYDASNALIGTFTQTTNVDASLAGRLLSLNIDPLLIESNTAYMTLDLTSQEIV